MTRLAKYKEFFLQQPNHLHDGYSLDEVLTETRNFISENDGTLDAIAAKTYLVIFLISEGKFTETGQIIDSFEKTGDDLVDYLILDVSSNYYHGFNDPSLDISKSDEFHKEALKLTEKIVFQDQWEESIVRNFNVWRILFRTRGQSEILVQAKKFEELLMNSKGLGNFKFRYLNMVAIAYNMAGHLDYALKLYHQALDFFLLSDWSILYLNNIGYSYYWKNNLEKSKEYLSKSFEKSNKSTNYWLKEMPLLLEAKILESEQKFDDLEQNRINSLKLAYQYKNFLKISERYFELFSFYINRFKNTEKREFLEKALKVKEEFDEFMANQATDNTSKRLNAYANALLLRLGTLKQKVQATNIFEDLIKLYPNNPRLKLDLIELLWDDLEYDINGESKGQIDSLMLDLKNLPDFFSKSLEDANVSFNILLAKYNFYINGKGNEALETLYSIQSMAISFGYKMVEEKVNKEIKLLENDSNWVNIDPSFKERLNRVKLKSYIEGAQLFLNTD